MEEEKEIGSDEEDKGDKKEDLGGLVKLEYECKCWKEFVGDMTSGHMDQLSGEVINQVVEAREEDGTSIEMRNSKISDCMVWN